MINGYHTLMVKHASILEVPAGDACTPGTAICAGELVCFNKICQQKGKGRPKNYAYIDISCSLNRKEVSLTPNAYFHIWHLAHTDQLN